MQVSIQEAEQRLAELVAAAEAGEEIVIARDSVPVVRLVAVRAGHRPVRLGVLAGQIELGDDVDAPLAEFEPLALTSEQILERWRSARPVDVRSLRNALTQAVDGNLAHGRCTTAPAAEERYRIPARALGVRPGVDVDRIRDELAQLDEARRH